MQEYERKFEQSSEDQKFSKLCSDAGLKLVEQGQYFYTLDTKEGQQIQHLCREYTMSRNEKGLVNWVRIVNGVDKNVTESMLTTNEEDIASVKPIAKARPSQKPTVTLTSVSILVLEREWIVIATQRSHDHKGYEASKAITRLLRHDQSVPRGSDGAIHCSDIIEECTKKKFDDASQW